MKSQDFNEALGSVANLAAELILNRYIDNKLDLPSCVQALRDEQNEGSQYLQAKGYVDWIEIAVSHRTELLREMFPEKIESFLSVWNSRDDNAE